MNRYFRSLGRRVHYSAMLLIAASWVLGVPTVFACEKFYPHTELSACRKQNKEAWCQACKCYALDIPGSKRTRKAWVVPHYKSSCQVQAAELEKLSYDDLTKAFAR